MSDFLLNIYQGAINLFSDMLSIILLPIDLLIEQVIPNYSDLSMYVNYFFNWCEDMALFVLSWIHIPPFAIDLIIGYVSFKIVIYFGTLSYKLFIRWWNTLKV